jgi:hypothetical protein
MSTQIARTVVHYALHDPRTHTGGVETFARNLGLVFERVQYMTPETIDIARVRAERLPVICDNHWVTDWPADVPVIGFQHGMAARKLLAIPTRDTVAMALRQRRAAKRPRTLWVACAGWISQAFARLHGNRSAHVVYHAVDLDRFDGKLDNVGSRLVLHDGRAPHKGSRLWPHIEREFSGWRFEPLNCKPAEVPDRMRTARAFMHFSRYEGNSIVCNEAMAMDLPCLFTKVGLMLDGTQQFDLQVVNAVAAFGSKRVLLSAVRKFLHSLETRTYNPRRWVLKHASFDAHVQSWHNAMNSFDAMRWG